MQLQVGRTECTMAIVVGEWFIGHFSKRVQPSLVNVQMLAGF
jgi:hypothetical protein